MKQPAVKKSVNRMNPYLVKEIMEATPEKLLLKLYDIAIVSCQKKDMVKANDAIGELISSLNYDRKDAKDIAINLLRLYQFSQEQTRKGHFDMAHRILSELRGTWQQLFENTLSLAN